MENQFVYKPSKIVELMEKKLDAQIDVAISINRVKSLNQEINHIIFTNDDLSKSFFKMDSLFLTPFDLIDIKMNCIKYLREGIRQKKRLITAFSICIDFRNYQKQSKS